MEDVMPYLWAIFSLNIVNTGTGLFILGSSLIYAVRHTAPWLAQHPQQMSPANPGSLPRILIWLFIALLSLTVVSGALFGCKVAKLLNIQVDPLALTSVVQGFVYGTAGIVIGLRCSQR